MKQLGLFSRSPMEGPSLICNKFTRRSFLAGSLMLVGSALLPSSLKKEPLIISQGKASDPPDLDFASAIEAAEAILRRKISSVELTKNTLKRIDRYNPSINAVITLLRDEALARAREADNALAKGEWWGPLHGVPITIKDSFIIANVRTTAGAPFLADYIPTKDSVVVSRLRAAGAVILGHTNVPFMLDDWQSYNEIFGTTNNPWDLKRTPGGSTGGGAAALAAGLSYLSIGSDIGGSIRIPAHFCGVYGHKPTLNVIPTRGHIPPLPESLPQPPQNLAVAGPLARTAADLEMALKILGGPDSEEAIAYSWSLAPARSSCLADYRIGYVIDNSHCPVLPEIKELMIKVVEVLRKAGAKIEEGWPSGVDPVDQYNTYHYLLKATSASSLQDDQIEEMKKRAKKQDGSHRTMQSLAWTAPHKYFLAANSKRMAARAVWQEYFRKHDVFLMPTAFVPAFLHDHSDPWYERTILTSEGQRSYEDLRFWISFATLAGLPATIPPIGLTKERLPVGIQIIGPYLEDATPIDLAGKLANIIGGYESPKGY